MMVLPTNEGILIPNSYLNWCPTNATRNTNKTKIVLITLRYCSVFESGFF